MPESEERGEKNPLDKRT